MPLHIPVLRPASLAGPTSGWDKYSVARHHKTSLTVCMKPPVSFLVMDSASPRACNLVRVHPKEACRPIKAKEGNGGGNWRGLVQ